MESNVNAALYQFLLKNETGMYRNKNEIIAYVHVYFWDLKEFAELVGPFHFDEGGMNVQMFQNTICIELNNIIEGEGQELISYRECFDDSDIKSYESELVAMSER